MYKIPKRTRTSIDAYDAVEGEPIEVMISRLINDGIKIDNEKIPIYTKPSEGVVYGTDIRGDKWEKAIEVSEKINKDIDRIREMKIVKKQEEKDLLEGKINDENEGTNGQNEGEK